MRKIVMSNGLSPTADDTEKFASFESKVEKVLAPLWVAVAGGGFAMAVWSAIRHLIGA